MDIYLHVGDVAKSSGRCCKMNCRVRVLYYISGNKVMVDFISERAVMSLRLYQNICPKGRNIINQLRSSLQISICLPLSSGQLLLLNRFTVSSKSCLSNTKKSLSLEQHLE